MTVVTQRDRLDVIPVPQIWKLRLTEVTVQGRVTGSGFAGCLCPLLGEETAGGRQSREQQASVDHLGLPPVCRFLPTSLLLQKTLDIRCFPVICHPQWLVH